MKMSSKCQGIKKLFIGPHADEINKASAPNVTYLNMYLYSRNMTDEYGKEMLHKNNLGRQ